MFNLKRICDKEHCGYKAKFKIGRNIQSEIFSCGEHLNYFLSAILEPDYFIEVTKI